MRTARFSAHLGGRGVSAYEGGCLPGGCLPRRGVHLPPVNRITNRFKNFTFLQLRLRAVRMPFKIVNSNSMDISRNLVKQLNVLWKSTKFGIKSYGNQLVVDIE